MSIQAVLNTALQPLSIRVAPGEDGEWAVASAAILTAFEDGMTIGQVGPSSRSKLAARASVIHQYLKQKLNDVEKKIQAVRASPNSRRH